jgi:hypothetical protein
MNVSFALTELNVTQLNFDISNNLRLVSVLISGGPIQSLNARGCPNLKKIEGDIEVLDVSRSGLQLDNSSCFNCTRSGSQVLLAQDLVTKLSSASALGVIQKCLWSSRSERKLLDLARVASKKWASKCAANTLHGSVCIWANWANWAIFKHVLDAHPGAG